MRLLAVFIFQFMIGFSNLGYSNVLIESKSSAGWLEGNSVMKLYLKGDDCRRYGKSSGRPFEGTAQSDVRVSLGMCDVLTNAIKIKKLVGSCSTESQVLSANNDFTEGGASVVLKLSSDCLCLRESKSSSGWTEGNSYALFADETYEQCLNTFKLNNKTIQAIHKVLEGEVATVQPPLGPVNGGGQNKPTSPIANSGQRCTFQSQLQSMDYMLYHDSTVIHSAGMVIVNNGAVLEVLNEATLSVEGNSTVKISGIHFRVISNPYKNTFGRVAVAGDELWSPRGVFDCF